MKKDEEAWKVLWEQHYPVLFLVALKILRNREDAQDTVQNTCESLIEDWAGREGELVSKEHAKAYLLRALRYHCVNLIRSRVSRHKKLEELYEKVISSVDLHPEKELEFCLILDEFWQKGFPALSEKKKELFLFLLNSLDADSANEWRRWAEAHSLPIDNTRERNNFYQLKTRLKNEVSGFLSDQTLEASRKKEWEQ